MATDDNDDNVGNKNSTKKVPNTFNIEKDRKFLSLSMFVEMLSFFFTFI